MLSALLLLGLFKSVCSFSASQQVSFQPLDNGDSIDRIAHQVQRILQQHDDYAFDEGLTLARISDSHEQDFDNNALAIEIDPAVECTTQVEDILVNQYKIGVRTMEPLLTNEQITDFQEAANTYWRENSSSSRFTYQRIGNYEAHVSDLPTKSILDTVLVSKIYPLIRNNFHLDDDTQLYVYDALVIRYNATEAKEGAGQPLHKDLGLVSVNIQLSQDFQGGGTFLENQLRQANQRPVQPLGLGRAIVHASTERHAGAMTFQGVRDVLVIFVTGRMLHEDNPPIPIQSALLKQCRAHCESICCSDTSIPCRIAHLNMAIQRNPSDGEAFQYLATALFDYANRYDDDLGVLETAEECLELAVTLTPCDSRVYNNWALVRSKRMVESSLVESKYQKSLDLLDESGRMHVDVGDELACVVRNYGLFLANQDRFPEACRVLERVVQQNRDMTSEVDQQCYTTGRNHVYCS